MQEAQQQVQAQLMIEIIHNAGLDANNAEHQKMAAQVLKDVIDLQDPARKPERDAMMREFGIQPDEYEKAIAEYNQRGDALKVKQEELLQRDESLMAKFKSRGTVRAVISLAGGVAGAFGVVKKWFSGDDVGKMKKGAGGLAGLIGGALVAGYASSFFTTKPVMKSIERLDQDKISLAGDEAKLMEEAGKYNIDTLKELSTRVLKSRAENAPQQASAEIEAKPEAAKPVEAKDTSTFTDKVAEKGIAPEDIVKQKQAAEAAEAHIG